MDRPETPPPVLPLESPSATPTQRTSGLSAIQDPVLRQILQALQDDLEDHDAQILELKTRLESMPRPSVPRDSSPGPSSHPREPKVALPPEFTGKVSEFENFMAQCSLVFELRPSTYSTDKAKVLFIVSRLSGSAFQWARSIISDPYHPLRSDYPAFKSALGAVYSDRTC